MVEGKDLSQGLRGKGRRAVKVDCVVEQQVCGRCERSSNGQIAGREDAFGVARRNRVECFSDLRFSGNFIRGRAKLSAENWSPIRVCDLISRPYQCDSPQHHRHRDPRRSPSAVSVIHPLPCR